MIELRPLRGVGWAELTTAFEAAFSDYAVPMKMNAAALAAMQLRRGYDPGCSFGAFAGAELVGFSLTCREGDRAYDSGTGVAPPFRRGGLARRLVEAALAAAGASSPPASRFFLEVIEHNEAAVALYRSLGFVETRRLQCWTYAGDPKPAPAAPPAPPAPPDPQLVAALLAEVEAEAELAPSWQNTLASIRRAPEPYLTLADEHGLAIVFPRTADLPLLYVRRPSRRRGHGRRLLAAALAAVAADAVVSSPPSPEAVAPAAPRPLRLINLDERVGSVAAFLSSAGATRTVCQLEMVRTLP